MRILDKNDRYNSITLYIDKSAHHQQMKIVNSCFHSYDHYLHTGISHYIMKALDTLPCMLQNFRQSLFIGKSRYQISLLPDLSWAAPFDETHLEIEMLTSQQVFVRNMVIISKSIEQTSFDGNILSQLNFITHSYRIWWHMVYYIIMQMYSTKTPHTADKSHKIAIFALVISPIISVLLYHIAISKPVIIDSSFSKM